MVFAQFFTQKLTRSRWWWGVVGLALLLTMVLPIGATQAATGVNKVLYYQGRLQDDAGDDVADGSYDMIFVVYDAASGGTCQWISKGTCGSPTVLSVTVTSGLFTVALGDTSVGGGSQNAMDDTLFDDDTRYLEVRVEGETLSPRKAVGAAAYAFNTLHINGLTSSQFLRADTATSFSGSTITYTTDTNFVLSGGVNGLSFDTDTLSIDATNNRIGLGDTTPDAPLDIALANGTALTLGGVQLVPGIAAQQTLSLSANNDYPVGLLVNPTFSDGVYTSTLHIGVYGVTGYDGAFSNIFQNTSTNASASADVWVMNSGVGSAVLRVYSTGHSLANTSHLYVSHDFYLQYGNTDSTKDFYLTNGSGVAAADITLTALDSNYVGIGDTSPDYLLELGSASTGVAPTLALSDNSNVSITRTGYQTDLFGVLTVNSSSDGGLFIEGLSDTDATGVSVVSYVGSADPTDTTPAMVLKAAKKSVAATQALGALETVLQVKNFNTNLLTVLGSGYTGIGDATPGYLLEVSTAAAADPTFAVSDGDVAHGITDVAETDVLGMFRVIDSTAGGLDMVGISDDDVSGLGLNGIIGAADPADDTPAVEVFGVKKSGTTIQALADAETVFQITNNTTPLLAVLGNGRTGIGDTTPGYKLDVFVDEASYVANFFNDGNNADRHGLRVQAGADDGTTGTTYYLDAYDGDGGQVGYIANTTGTFALTDPSDIRTKTNVTDTTWGGLDVVNQLRVVDYNRLQNPDGPRITGFIAQEVQPIFPNMVNEGANGILGITKDSLIPILVKAVQEQQAMIATLQFAGRSVVMNASDPTAGGALEFEQQIVVNRDNAGQARLEGGANSVTVQFEEPYTEQPIVTITPVGFAVPRYGVERVNTHGFDIVMETPADEPTIFNWHAFGVFNGWLTSSDGTREGIVVVEDFPVTEVSGTATTVEEITEEVVEEDLPIEAAVPTEVVEPTDGPAPENPEQVVEVPDEQL